MGSLNWRRKNAGILYYGDDGSITMGEFASSAAAGSGMALDADRTKLFAAYGEATSDLTSAVMVRPVLGRMLISGAVTSNAELFGVVGQLVAKAATLAHDNAGVLGTFESQSTAVTISGTGGDNCTAAVMGRVGVSVTSTTVNATGILAGVAAMSNITSGYVTITTGGVLSAFYAGKFSSKQNWDYGLRIDEDAIAVCPIQVGEFVSSAAAGGGFAVSATATGAMRVYSEVTADLTNSVLVRSILGRMLVTGAITSNAEVFGLQGQLVSKAATLCHDNAGVLGTFEAQGTAVTISGTGGDNCTAAILGRVGVTITATTVNTTGVLAGVAAMSNITNGYVTVSGNGILAAFYAGRYTSTTMQVWDYGLYLATGTVKTGVKFSATTLGVISTVTALAAGDTPGNDFRVTAANANNSYGVAGYFESDISGTQGGTFVYGSGSWINLAAAAIIGAGKYCCAQDNGIYLDGSVGELANSKLVFGLRAEIIGAPADALIFPFSLNTNNTLITALFECMTTDDLGVSATGRTTTATYLPILRDAGGNMRYVLLYS